jgi:serine/threonine protein kinase
MSVAETGGLMLVGVEDAVPLARVPHATPFEMTTVVAIPDARVDTLTGVYEPRSADSLERGTMIGDYEIEAKLAAGGMGVVYSAVHPLIGRRVAIKVLHTEHAHSGVADRFVDEARAVNRIGHPNIVDIFTLATTSDGLTYLVMELLVGETLASRMQRCGLSLDDSCVVLRTLALALEAAHAHDIIHRDLKPDNVFLVERDGAPFVKLLDFGIAKLADASRTQRGVLVGTPSYMAPEQTRGLRVDHRVDTYGLGVIAFELLTGRPPFSGNLLQLLQQHAETPPPRPSELARSIPPALDDLVVAMLAKDPNERPSLARVRAVLDAVAVTPAPRTLRVASTAPLFATTPRRRKRSRITGALAAAGVAAAFAFGLARDTEPRPAPAPQTAHARAALRPIVTPIVP